MRRHDLSAGRIARGAFAVAFVGVSVLGPMAAAGAAPDPAKDGISNLAACYSQNGRLAIELVIDESRSLRGTDPSGSRVELAQAITEATAQIASVPIDGKPGIIDIRVVGFGSKVSDDSSWHRLDRTSADQLADDLEKFRERDDQKGTDYVEALTQATADVVSRSAKIGKSDPSGVCRAIVWFTDGSLDFDTSGDAPGWAPDLPITGDASRAEAIERGEDLLCEDGGIADQLRSGEVYLLTAGLLSKRFQEEQAALLRKITEGGDGCGSLPGTPTGRYFSDNDIGRLVREIIPSITKPPPIHDEGNCPARETCVRSFDVSEVTVAVSLLVYPQGKGKLVLQSPSGEQVDLRPRRSDEAVDGATVTSRAAGSNRLVGIDLAKAEASAVGTWEVRFTPKADPASLEIWTSLRTGISLRPQRPDAWTRGVEGSITFDLIDAAGKVLDPAVVTEVDLQGRVKHGTADLSPVALDRTPGSSQVVLRVTPVVDQRAASATATVSGNVTTSAGEVTLVGAWVTIPVAVPGAPRPPSTLNLGVVTAERQKERTADHHQPVKPIELHRKVTVRGAPDSDGTFCLAATSKATAGTATVIIRPEGERCRTVPVDGTVELPVVVSIAKPEPGPFGGSTSSTVTSGISKEQVDIDIPVTGDLVVPPGDPWVDPGEFWRYLLIGFGVPAFVWLAVCWLNSKFNNVSLIKAFKVPVTVRASGTTFERPPLQRDEWSFLAPAGDRGATFDDLEIRAPIRIVSAQDAQVTRPGHLVFGPLGTARSLRPLPLGRGRRGATRKGRIAHQIQGQWAFTVPDGTSAPEGVDVVVGELYFFVLDGALTLEAESGGLIDRSSKEVTDHLPDILKRLRAASPSPDQPGSVTPPPDEPDGLM